jgi:hypothetical protein
MVFNRFTQNWVTRLLIAICLLTFGPQMAMANPNGHCPSMAAVPEAPQVAMSMTIDTSDTDHSIPVDQSCGEDTPANNTQCGDHQCQCSHACINPMQPSAAAKANQTNLPTDITWSRSHILSVQPRPPQS